jgi:hypothetical protein
MSTINSYGLDAVAPYVLALQLLAAVLIWWVGRWRWLLGYLVALPLIWYFSLTLYSAHCLACGEGIWFLPLCFLFAAFAVVGHRQRRRKG